ncbi:L,D-transpeptidase family protein [Cytobacillus spongiae]|uniref:L,D-transpeptidase family protein n=1 Tax=Cytobacillus spongiae TaxID=2901381 RepID=UPI001F02D132|nr:L,D-transpeptidase family protein [Cytobacillus spongiae]UII57213.1 L,D-transpeptidase family protein [Cytobacillus spongiae]
MNHIVQTGETLSLIARNYRRTLQQLLTSNPNINPNLIYPGQSITIPGLPDPQSIPYRITISLNQRILTLYKNNTPIKKFPIAIGKMLTRTPVGQFVVVNREPNPGGPFGSMWLTLSKVGYGIHGTNNPSSIGKAVSQGCVRMYNKDVLELASIVPNGTYVSINP